MSEAVKIQDPLEVLDYSLDWTIWLAGDTIAASSWVITPAGPTLSGQAQTGAATVCLVAAVTLAGVYRLTNTVTTAQGRTSDRSLTIRAFPQ
jgi:hypothetical protein